MPVPPNLISDPVEFHLHPQYREQTPLDPVLHKRQAVFDDFELEKDHDQIASLLGEWCAALRQSPTSTKAVERLLAPSLEASSLRPTEEKILRSGNALRVRRLQFAAPNPLDAKAFAKELQSSLADFSELMTADLQITQIDRSSGHELRTEIRYELVGSGKGFFREQRVGTWVLNWQESSDKGYEVQSWQQGTETRSRSAAPFFQDQTSHALGGNSSYSEQLVHGVDYWRTVLDGASHIDIYGHNGVAVGDAYGTGFDDLYICQPAGLPNRLYRNRGDGTFADVTTQAGVGVLENTACALFADFQNRGRQDLLVVRAEGPLLFVNQGDGTFQRKPNAFQFANPPQGTFTGAAAADYDRDGWLDIYFCLYVYYQGAGQYKYPTPYFDANNGPPNFLMRNNRDGTFRDQTAQAGLNQNNTRYSFCCGWTDVNQDGWPDLYVVNDFGRKNLYRNKGDGTFLDVADEAGLADVGAGMSVCAFDYTNDGREDLYVADMWTAAGERITAQAEFQTKASAPIRNQYRKHAMGNSLFRNTTGSAFEDKTLAAGVGVGRWAWSSDAWDFDHDGFQDLYVTNGMISGPLREDLNSFFWRQVVGNSPDEQRPSHSYEQGWTAINELIRADYSWSGYERNVFFANHGDGTFSDVSGAIGLDFLDDGRAFALADLDHDGRLELVLKNRSGPQVRVLQNIVQDLPPSISFRLRGTRSNRDGIGTSITIETTKGRQTRILQAGSGFLSQHSKELLFGLGAAAGAIKATIRWPSGSMQTLDGLLPGQTVFVDEGSENHRSEPYQPVKLAPRAEPEVVETLPETTETWLLVPVSAPEFTLPNSSGKSRTLSEFLGKPFLLHLTTADPSSTDLPILTLNFAEAQSKSPGVLRASDDVAAVYNILYRMLFDRHRDLALPTSFLLNAQGEIVKIYQGAFDGERVRHDLRSIPQSDTELLAKALPFAGNGETFAFGRNDLSLGSVYFQRGYFTEAESAFRLALRDDTSSAEACYGLGSAYFKLAKIEDAQFYFEKATKLTASYPETKPNAWNNLGLISMQRGQADAAVQSFKEALRLQPDYLISLQNLGNAYRSQRRWQDAETTLEQALRIAPDDPEVNYSLAMVFAQLNQPERAFELLREALRLRPTYPEAMNNLGVLYLRTHRRDDAVKQFEKCIQVAPSFNQSYLNLARVYMIEGNRDDARATLLALLKQVPNDPQAQKALEQLN